MTKAEEYLKLAEEADERARVVRDMEARKTYRELAANWRELAAQAVRNGWRLPSSSD